MQEGRSEAAESAAVEQVGGSDTPSKSLEQAVRAASEEATQVCTGLAEDPSGAKGSAGGRESGGTWSGSISDAAGETTGDGHAAGSEGSSVAKASDPPSSSSSASEQWAGVSQAHMQIEDEADSGWITVKATRRRVRKQAENVAPASPHRATASAVAALLKPALKASRASGHKARLPESPQCLHDTQVRHRTAACSAHIV